ncbi:hypothetical protein F383_08562 [Gossypium arboreum]|uniref:Uncharacterized protein n=1 Tax=Gossypium arboreum TaxID=29729 RepID=A0A0B0P4Z5_GOSAR|nr:hypothetical protein F383_08562 [Gossypium arboreum]
MPYLLTTKFKSTNRQLDSVMRNSDLSETSDLLNLYKTWKKKQNKLYSLVSPYNSELNLPFIQLRQ